MPLLKVPREEVIQRLFKVFRLHGYEGASLAMIAQEAGLQKASLYHLFPGGKEEMATAVLEQVGVFLEERILAPLRASGAPAARLEIMREAVEEFYGAGVLNCLFDAFSLGQPGTPLRAGLAGAMNAWLDTLAALAREAGAPSAEARLRAERVLVTIQGTLVVARCLNDPKVFARGLRELPSLLLADPA